MNDRFTERLVTDSAGASSAQGDTVLDFEQIFRILREGWWIVAGCALAGALVAAVTVLQITPTFQARAELLMGQQTRSDDALGNLVQELNLDEDTISGEIAIITSSRILTEVSERLNLAARPEFNSDLRPPEPEQSFLGRMADGAVDLLRSIIGVAPPDATVPEDDLALLTDPVDRAALAGRASLGDQALFVDELAKNLRVRPVGTTRLVEIRYTSTDRRVAAAVPNTVIDVYLEDQLDRKFAALRRVTQGLNSRLNDMRARLEASERAVIDYRNQALSDGFGGQERLEQQLRDLSARLSIASAEHAELVSELTEIDALIAREGTAAAAGLFPSEIIEQMRSQIAELRQRQALLLERFGSESPQVRDMDGEVIRLEATIDAEVSRLRDDLAKRTELASAREQTLRQRLRELESLAIQQAEREVRLIQLEREQAASQAVYESFLDKFTETSEVADLQEVDAQVIAYADPPPAPIAPNKKLAVALGTVAGGFAGLGLVFLLSLTDRRVRSVTQLRGLLRGAHVVGLPRERRGLRRIDPLNLVAGRPHSPLSEAVRSLRSYLMLSGPKEGRIMALVSTRAQAGKTTSSLLLARSVAQMGVSCVVVDTDLRRSTIATRLGVPVRPDLIDVLNGQVPLETALRRDPRSEVRYLNARVGLSDPAGVLLSRQMKDLLQQLSSKFDLVILDTAPLVPVSDAIPMARSADRVVMLVRYGTPADEIETGVSMLEKVGVSVDVGVLSMVPPRAQPHYDYYTNYYTSS